MAASSFVSCDDGDYFWRGSPARFVNLSVVVACLDDFVSLILSNEAAAKFQERIKPVVKSKKSVQDDESHAAFYLKWCKLTIWKPNHRQIQRRVIAL